MSVKAEIVLDSISPEGERITTFLLTYPRIIHAELMTHRVFSRNTSSSRAIPVLTQILNTVRNMAAPVAWGSNKPGMQAGDELEGWRLAAAKTIWYGAGYGAALASYLLAKLGAHKQISNRPLEPWTHVTVVLTSTDFRNWFALRDHKDADPTIHALARTMKRALAVSGPKVLQPGQWHLPFILPGEFGLPLEDQQMLSAARCAVTSFNRSKPVTLEDARRIWSKLIDSTPMHASPVEHQATPGGDPKHWGNLRGWTQLRKLLPNEAVYG